MGAFEYTALDANGREKKGVLEGDTARHIRQLLREKQLLPVAVEPVSEKEATRQRTSFSFARRVSNRVVFMADGQILEENTPDEFFDHPQTARAKEFLESIKGH